MKNRNSTKLLLVVVVIVFSFLIYRGALTGNTNEYVSSMPLTSNSEQCIRRELNQITWANGQTYSFIKFSDTLVSRPDFVGYLKISSVNEGTHQRVRPIMNMLMSKCFSEVIYEFKFNYPFEEKLLDDLNFVLENDGKAQFNKLNVELDFQKRNLRIFSE